ncbi:uncharacterized protein LOC115233018 [Formica exsecta]|uniref:uncharacterized protein LOC115233018 n=1 Tax=Formica exsecta TaxID=72781 RepID=UPI0011444A57|nr:uncharacterized protein LOC115233018 [Formica exsecta]
MMYTLKGSYAVMTLLLFTRTHGDLFRHAEQHQRYNPTIPSLPWYLASTQEIVLHDIILKSIIPASFDIKAIQKRPLDASFYGGPIAATYSSDGVLSHGNVYRLLNGHWMLCEDGCVDCDPCATQGNPLFKWILQSARRPSDSDPLRHDFQLTIISQMNDHFRTSNFWPNNYNYVISGTERSSILVTSTQHDNATENSLPNLENSFSQQHNRSKDLWQLTERDSISQEENHIQGNASTDKPLEQKHRFRNMRHRPRPVEKTAKEANQLAPKLILGTDQQGQKHLIHVVPADHPPINTSHFANLLAPNHSISSHFVEGEAIRLNNTIPKHEKQTYQRIFRRVFDSLNTHRQSIESFLKSPNNVSEQRIASSMDDVAGFPWHNRDVNHTNANFETLRLNETLLSPLYVKDNDEIEKYQQHKNNYDYQHVKPDVNNYYANRNQTRISRGQLPINFDFNRERRKARVRPYSINTKNISKINSSILLQSSDSSLIDIPKPDFNNDFVINYAKQINPNETFIDKANNDFIESSSIIIKRENERVFNSERLASGDANREFETSHHAFRIITTESPVIQKGHETLNRTATLQINTSKTFADNQ